MVIKAQVLVGGRGKAGGVKLAQDPAEAEQLATQILGDGDQGPAGAQGPGGRGGRASKQRSTSPSRTTAPRGNR